MKRYSLAGLILTAIAVVIATMNLLQPAADAKPLKPLKKAAGEAKQATPAPDDKAVERSRKTVKMLDDIYKTAVVLITDKYVNDKDDFPAGGAAVAWFDAISKKGWHDVRIIDATGAPSNPENVANDDFEKEGLKQLKSGKEYYDRVRGKRRQVPPRAVTAVPVVMDKCIMCHENYKKAKKGEAIERPELFGSHRVTGRTESNNAVTAVLASAVAGNLRTRHRHSRRRTVRNNPRPGTLTGAGFLFSAPVDFTLLDSSTRSSPAGSPRERTLIQCRRPGPTRIDAVPSGEVASDCIRSMFARVRFAGVRRTRFFPADSGGSACDPFPTLPLIRQVRQSERP